MIILCNFFFSTASWDYTKTIVDFSPNQTEATIIEINPSTYNIRMFAQSSLGTSKASNVLTITTGGTGVVFLIANSFFCYSQCLSCMLLWYIRQNRTVFSQLASLLYCLFSNTFKTSSLLLSFAVVPDRSSDRWAGCHHTHWQSCCCKYKTKDFISNSCWGSIPILYLRTKNTVTSKGSVYNITWVKVKCS